MTSDRLPEWLAPVAEKVADMRAEDLSAFVPPEEGGRESAVLILFVEDGHGPDVLLI